MENRRRRKSYVVAHNQSTYVIQYEKKMKNDKKKLNNQKQERNLIEAVDPQFHQLYTDILVEWFLLHAMRYQQFYLLVPQITSILYHTSRILCLVK